MFLRKLKINAIKTLNNRKKSNTPRMKKLSQKTPSAAVRVVTRLKSLSLSKKQRKFTSRSLINKIFHSRCNINIKCHKANIIQCLIQFLLICHQCNQCNRSNQCQECIHILGNRFQYLAIVCKLHKVCNSTNIHNTKWHMLLKCHNNTFRCRTSTMERSISE